MNLGQRLLGRRISRAQVQSTTSADAAGAVQGENKPAATMQDKSTLYSLNSGAKQFRPDSPSPMVRCMLGIGSLLTLLQREGGINFHESDDELVDRDNKDVNWSAIQDKSGIPSRTNKTLKSTASPAVLSGTVFPGQGSKPVLPDAPRQFVSFPLGSCSQLTWMANMQDENKQSLSENGTQFLAPPEVYESSVAPLDDNTGLSDTIPGTLVSLILSTRSQLGSVNLIQDGKKESLAENETEHSTGPAVKDSDTSPGPEDTARPFDGTRLSREDRIIVYVRIPCHIYLGVLT